MESHGSDTAVLCAKFQNDWSLVKYIMGKQDFVRFEFKISFGGISNTITVPWFCYNQSHCLQNIHNRLPYFEPW